MKKRLITLFQMKKHPVNIYLAQEQNICAFYDDDDYVITHDVFMGHPEADKTQFTINEYFYNNNQIYPL